MFSKNTPYPIRMAFVFLLLNIIIWGFFAIAILSGSHVVLPDQPYVDLIMGGLALITAFALTGLLYLLQQRNRLALQLTLPLLALIAFLSITDDIGWPDLFVLIVSIAPFLLLLKERRWFERKSNLRSD